MLEYNHKQDATDKTIYNKKDDRQTETVNYRNGKLQEQKESFCKKKGKQ